MTNKGLAIGLALILFLALGVNTFFVIELTNKSDSHHAQTATKIDNLERAITRLGGNTK